MAAREIAEISLGMWAKKKKQQSCGVSLGGTTGINGT